jgi:hypothetical protein
MTDEEAFAAFRADLVALGAGTCSHCGRQLDHGDVAWNNADTGGGTPHSVYTITCLGCGTEADAGMSWWPGDVTTFAQFFVTIWRERAMSKYPRQMWAR